MLACTVLTYDRMTSCVINVDRARHVAPKQLGLKSGRLCCSRCPSTDGLSMLIDRFTTVNQHQLKHAGERHVGLLSE